MSIAKSRGRAVVFRRLSGVSVCAVAVAIVASACGSESAKKAARRSDYAGEAGQSPSLGGQPDNGAGGASGAPVAEGGTEGNEAGAGGAAQAGVGAGGAAEAGAGGAPDKCPSGFDDCDQNPDDCETPVDSEENCGMCGVSCSSANGTAVCQELNCTVTSCLTGFGDCNDSGTDGCESPINTAANCGSCGNDCGTATCDAGGFCNASTIGSAMYAGRALLAGTAVYRLSVPAPNYWVQASYSLVRTPVDGSAEVIMDAQNKQIGGMVATATDVYWGVGGVTAGVFKKGLNAPAADAPTPVFTPPTLPMQMVIQDTAMYFVGVDGKIYKRAMDAAATEPGTEFLTAAEVAGTGTFNIHQPLVATPTRLYWIVAGTGAGILRTAPLDGGPATDVAGAAPRTWMPLAVNGEDIYYVQSSGSAFDGVYHYKPGGTAQGLVFKSGLSAVAVDSEFLYFMEAETKLYKAPLTGGMGTQIGLTLSSAKDIVGFGASSTYLSGIWTRGNGFSYGKAFVLPK